MIKATKKADEELMAAFIGAESLINTRPPIQMMIPQNN